MGSSIKHRYYIEMTYSYKYNGKVYQNDKSEICFGFEKLEDAQNAIKEIKDNLSYGILTKFVFVNPKDPQNSLFFYK